LLQIKNLKVHFPVKGSIFSSTKFIKAVDDITFTVNCGEILGVVGESGCGKSSLAKALVGLNPITSGEVIFATNKLLHTYKKSHWQQVYKDIQFIFQDPVAALDPRMTVLEIIREPLLVYRSDLNKNQQIDLVIQMMEKVGLSREHINRYPSEFSGGQCQRIAIARALILNPKLLICDEAVSALDATVKVQIINLLKQLQQEMKLTIIFISHDLSVVRHICDRVLVMYLGNIMELANTATLYARPLHPYTKILLNAAPVASPKIERHKKIEILTGELPSNIDIPIGCVFSSRCALADDKCQQYRPKLEEHLDGLAACFKVEQNILNK
jgi:oligopeptide transport system ATP-binding protein